MSQADVIFKQNLAEILGQEWEIDNRARWEDGSPVYTKRILHVVNKYDLSKEFPILTIKPTPIKSCFKEIDWIYRKRSNNIKDLGLRIWDSWADSTGSIGKAYGAQVAKPVFGYPSQIDYILGEIKRNPTSRRLIIELWNVDDLELMHLSPCCHHLNFSVKNGKLHLLLKQRSNDFLVANNFNVVEYALLMHIIARHCDLEVGTLTHIITDCHIYNKHEEAAYELLQREEYPAPKLWVNPEIKSFYDFTIDDFKLIDYKHGEQIKLEVAV
jgi:thymidylate synthase